MLQGECKIGTHLGCAAHFGISILGGKGDNYVGGMFVQVVQTGNNYDGWRFMQF